MIIGVPKEIKPSEWRVGLTPEAVGSLSRAGHRVLVGRGAGVAAGWKDSEYRNAGARIVSASEAWGSEQVVKVKEPQPSEYRFFRPGLSLFTFLHLAANRPLARALAQKGVKAIPYEEVRVGDTLPLLAPMSEIAGSLAALIGANYLRKDLGGRGTLLGSVGKGGPGRVLVVGAGHVGSSAAQVAHGLGAEVLLYDLNQEKLSQIKLGYPDRLEILSDEKDLAVAVARADLLIGAILRPGQLAPRVVRSSMVRSMQPGSVIVDVAVDQGGCVETTRPTTLKNPVYKKYGVLHYAVTNIPSLVPRTASEALSAVTLPYLLNS